MDTGWCFDFQIIFTINPEVTKSFFTFIMWRKCGFRFALFFPHLPKHFDEPYPLSVTPFVFLSLCVRKLVNSRLIDSKHTPAPPLTPYRREGAMHTNKHASLLKDRTKIVSSLSLRNYEWGEPKIDVQLPDSC
jgi:hypothetical protein